MTAGREEKYRLFMFFAKAGRALWIVILTIILIIAVVYGVFLNAFHSQGWAILLCVVLFGGIVFLSAADVRDAKMRYDETRRRRVVRASSRKGRV